MKFGKVFNPFFSAGKALGKGAKAAVISAGAVAAFAGTEHLLSELLPIIIGVGVPPPFGQMLALAVAGLLSGGVAAVANVKKNRSVTPEQLRALMIAADEEVVEENTVTLTQDQFEELLAAGRR